MNIMVTIPKMDVEDFEREVAEMEILGLNKLFKVSNIPKMVNVNDDVFFCMNNEVRFQGRYVGHSGSSFECETTGRDWSGLFIEIDHIKEIPPDKREKMVGFRGFRYKNRE